MFERYELKPEYLDDDTLKHNAECEEWERYHFHIVLGCPRQPRGAIKGDGALIEDIGELRYMEARYVLEDRMKVRKRRVLFVVILFVLFALLFFI